MRIINKNKNDMKIKFMMILYFINEYDISIVNSHYNDFILLMIT